MASIIGDAERRPAARNNGLLRIESRALVSDQLTIAISHIVTLTTGATQKPAVRRVSRWSMTLFAASPVTALVGIAAYNLLVTPSLLLTALLLIAAAYQLPRVDREPPRFQYYLRITTSDGGRLQFIAPTNDVVEHVRRIIADRINQDDQTTTYTVNFNNGAIASGSSASTGNVVRGVPIAQNTQPIFPHEHRVPGKVALGNPLNALHAQPIEHLFKPARYCESCDLEQPFPSPSCTKMRLKLSQL
jgi:hypothetical protein